MKRLFNSSLWLIIVALIFTSCSKDEDVQPDFEDVEFGFDIDNPPLIIPDGIKNSTDMNAGQIYGHLTMANSIVYIVSAMQPPSGATKSDESIFGRIGGDSGRTANIKTNVSAYTWTITDGNESLTYGYQLSETSTHYIFELFIKENNNEFIKYWHSERSKNGKQGFLELYDEDDHSLSIRFEWDETALGVFRFNILSDNEKINITSNPDYSGSIKVFENGKLQNHITWNANGTAGTYVYYNSNEEVEESGVWPE
ncbi:MAG: hypothetical protein KF860_02770 [Cyclobacteriaceae bacterium]|nr:hypothetical protein [Cyclobacteriaceae bacterium]